MAKYIDPGMRPADKLIPWYFVAFFAVIFIANGFLIYFAMGSQPGVIEKHHYEIGLDYDSRIAAKEAQEALGWAASVALDGPSFSVKMTDAAGRPLAGAQVTAEMVRAVQDGHDFETTLVETAPGQYGADIEFPRVPKR